MKAIFFLALLYCLLGIELYAQQTVVEKTMAVPANKKVVLNFGMGNTVKITAWDRQEASIKLSYSINGGRLNDAAEVRFDAENGVAHLDVEFDQKKLEGSQTEDCPDNESGSRYFNGSGKSTFICYQIDYEVFVPRDTDLSVESVHASIELNGLSGPVQAKAIHGYVDMSWPATKGASLSFKSIHGDVFSNMDIDFSEKKDQHLVRGNLNGGGTPIDLEAIHSNVYFRKLQ